MYTQIQCATLQQACLHALPQACSQCIGSGRGQDSNISPIMQAGYVHRDLRWDNTACGLEHCYFLLDLELCAKPGTAPSMTSSWPNGFLQDSGAYTELSDILVAHAQRIGCCDKPRGLCNLAANVACSNFRLCS